MESPKSILITGASSGLGAALALEYAASGVFLVLTGRNDQRLAEIAERCRSKGASAITAGMDVTESDALSQWIQAVDKERPLDLVIANAGISGGTGGGGESPDQVRQIFAVNVDGVLNTVLPALELMKLRQRGQIALMSSLASFRGFPGAPAYCASKAAVRVLGEALRGVYKSQHIEISVICPGFIKTPMTDVNTFSMPFLMSAEKAAKIIRRGLSKNKARLAFPWPVYALAWLVGVLPPSLTDFFMAQLPEKPAKNG